MRPRLGKAHRRQASQLPEVQTAELGCCRGSVEARAKAEEEGRQEGGQVRRALLLLVVFALGAGSWAGWEAWRDRRGRATLEVDASQVRPMNPKGDLLDQVVAEENAKAKYGDLGFQPDDPRAKQQLAYLKRIAEAVEKIAAEKGK